MTKHEKLLTTKDVAAYLNTSEATARRLCASGALHAKNIGTEKQKVWRVRLDDMEAFVPPAPATAKPKAREPDFIQIA